MIFRTANFKTAASKAVEVLIGMGIFWIFLRAGIFVKESLHLILPGNVLGMLLLLIAISAGLIKVRWIELAGKCLLFVLPMLFVPIYVGAGNYKSIWVQWAWLLVPALITSVIAMWIFVGHFYQWIGRRK